MIPILKNKKGNKEIGKLHDAMSVFVDEERNGLFELTLTYPADYPYLEDLTKENIIIADANDTLKNQEFRIYSVQKTISKRIKVLAQHISYDLLHDYTEALHLTNASCEYVLNTLFRQSQFCQHYRGFSDIINAQDYNIELCNLIQAIGGKEGSIIDTYGTGAEILRDNTNIHVLNSRGHDNGVEIAYRSNMTGFELVEDSSELITRIIPYAKYHVREEGVEDKEIMVHANPVDSPLIDNYAHPYIKWIDYSDKFESEEVPTTEKLTTLAEKEFRDNKVDRVKENYKINFIPLSKCVGYEDIEDKISLCDIVRIKNEVYNTDTKAKVIKARYDVLLERYDSMELGEPRTTLGDIIGTEPEKPEPGPPGPPGRPGADANMESFPDTVPNVPILNHRVLGFASIELNWSYEDKVYYTYELYASKDKGFTPNTFNLIHNGQSSSFLFQAKPGETWYFRVCAKNTHGRRTGFSSELTVTTRKVDDFDDYFSTLAVGNLVTQMFSTEYMEAGIVKGHWIDAKNLSVTDGNGKRTLDIDSFGNITLLPSVFNLSSECVTNIPTKDELQSKVLEAKRELNNSIDGVKNSVKGLKDYTDGAFKDDLLTEDEKSNIRGFLKPLETELADVTKEYNTLYSNVDLVSTPKTNLKNSYDSYKLKYDGLVSTINSLLKLTNINEGNKLALDNAYKEHDTMLANYRQRVNEAIDSIALRKSNNSLDASKTYTNAQIKTVNDSINMKVGRTEYDENNKVLGEKMAQVKLDVDGLQVRVEQTGSFNMIRNSDFQLGLNSWAIENCDMAYGFSGAPKTCGVHLGDCSGFNQTRYIAQYLDIRNDSVGAYTFSGYAWKSADSRPIEGEGREYSMANIYLEVVYKDNTHDWYNYNIIADIKPGTWTKFACTFHNEKPISSIRYFVYKRNYSGTMYVTQLKGEEGPYASPWTPSPNEIYTGITTINSEGIRVDHPDTGDYTKMGSWGIMRYRANGDARGTYHYLTQYIGFSGQDTVWVQLRDDFKGKPFTAYSVISDTWEGSWDQTDPWVVKRFVTYVQTDQIDYANARVPILIYRIDKNYKTGEHRKMPCAGILLVIA